MVSELASLLLSDLEKTFEKNLDNYLKSLKQNSKEPDEPLTQVKGLKNSLGIAIKEVFKGG